MNKITTNYFKNLFIRKRKLLILYFFVCFMAYPFVMFTNLLTSAGNNASNITAIVFYLALFALGVFAIVLPIFTFKFSLTKRHVDTYYAIPINRDHLFKAHFIAPIIGVCVPILVNYLIGGLLLWANSSFMVYLSLLIVLCLAFLVFVIIYSINTFFVLKCNNILDACIITAMITILPLFVYMTVTIFLGTQTVNNGMITIRDIPELVLKLLSPMNGLFIVEQIVRLEYSYPIRLSFHFGDVDWVMLSYYLVLGCGAIVGAYFTFKKKKGESAEQLTTDFITYPLLSNIALACLIICFNLMGNELTVNILIIVSLFVVFFIVNGIAKRSMKLTPLMAAEFIILMVLVNGFNYVSRQTEFFGINRQVLDYTNYTTINFEISTVDYFPLNEMKKTIIVKDIDKDDLALLDYVKVLQEKTSLNFKERGDTYIEDYAAYLDINYRSGYDEHYVHFYLDSEDVEMLRSLIFNVR